MKNIELEGMQKLLPSVEKAKIIGIIQEPEELSKKIKDKIHYKGMLIGGFIVCAVVIVTLYLTEKKEETEKQ